MCAVRVWAIDFGSLSLSPQRYAVVATTARNPARLLSANKQKGKKGSCVKDEGRVE